MTNRKWMIEIFSSQSKKSGSILTDYHMHSTFSPDAADSLDQMCQHALQTGFKEIAFTEHLEWHPEWRGTLNLDAYLKAIRFAGKKYSSQGLKVFAGIEVGNPHEYPDQATAFFLNQDFDIILASLHWLRGVNIHLKECFVGRDPTDVYTEYFLEIRRMSECCDFDVLAHFDRIFHTGWLAGMLPNLGQLESVIRSTLATLAGNNQILELNTKLFHLMAPAWKDIMITVITWYKEAGGTGISIGSDAHQLSEIGRHFEIAEEILKSTHFEVILPERFITNRERLITC